MASPVELKNIRHSTDSQARNSDSTVSTWETHLEGENYSKEITKNLLNGGLTVVAATPGAVLKAGVQIT